MRHIIILMILATLSTPGILITDKPEEICVRKLVSPRYPPLARQARLQGNVQLNVTLNEQGVPSELTLIDGPPLLVRAASDAVMNWQFCSRGVEPLNGRMLSIVVSFRLEGKQSDGWSPTEVRLLSPFNLEIITSPPQEPGPDVIPKT